MQVQINVGQETSTHELRSLAVFFNHLAAAGAPPVEQYAGATGSTVIIAPVASQTVEPATVVDTQPGSQPPEAGSEKTRRTRRTKAEIEAEAEAVALENSRIAEAEALAQKNNEAGLAKIETAEKINTETGEITAGADTVEEFETAGAAGGKTYTEAEVQNLASSVARAKGPQIVKDKIAELGATRIAALTADQLNSLGAFLETQK